MILIKANGVNLPTPTKYDFLFSDLDSENTGRDINLFMIRQRKRANVYSFSVAWDDIALDDLQTIFQATSAEMFQVQFFDLVTGAVKTKTMYSGNKKVSARIIKGDLSEAVCSISFNLVEK